MQLTDGKCELNVPEFGNNRVGEVVETSFDHFDICGQLDAYGPEENLDQTTKIYGMQLTDGKCELNVPEFGKK